jgi:hypothetical protein
VAYLFEQYQKPSGELFVEEKKRGKGKEGVEKGVYKYLNIICD